jgi:signal transduction histidine kinase/DNA-binding response OmpR family regulator/ligand-binding sensor domain-containing protein
MNNKNTSNKFFYFCLYFLFFSPAIHAEREYIFRHLDLIDGLSDSQIRSISMTPDGRIGIKTASIFNLYDGAIFEHFYHDPGKEYKWNRQLPPKEYYDHRGRVWIKEARYLLLLDLKTNQFIYSIEDELKTFGVESKLKDLFIDDAKNHWFVTENDDFLFYDIAKKELNKINGGQDDFTRKYGIPREICQYKNLYWIIYSSGLIRCWDYASHEFVLQDVSFLNAVNINTNRIYIHPTGRGDIWLMYNDEICFYNRTNKTWQHVLMISGLSNFFTCMDLDSKDNVWVGTSRSGLRYIDAKTLNVKVIKGLKLDRGVLDNDIHSVFIDDNDGLWVGTLIQGLCYYHPNMQKFQLFHTVTTERIITNEAVRCFLEEDDGTVLVGTANGLFRFHPDTEKIERIFQNQIEGLCLSLYRDRQNRIWVGTFLNGFYCIDGKQLKNYNITNKLNYNIGRSIYEDKSGRYWVSVNYDGVGQFDWKTGKINLLYEKYPQIQFHQVNYNFFPVTDSLLAIVGESGIYFYNTETDALWTPELDDPDSPQFQDVSIKYFCMLKDSRQLEWYATERGLRIWDNVKKKLYTIRVEDGLPNNTIMAMEEETEGVVWISTAIGITKINVSQNDKDEYTFSPVNFNTSEGLQSGKFYDRSSLKTGDGWFYFGGMHGFNRFNPKTITSNKNSRKPIFTAFKLFNATIKENIPYNGHIILQQPVNQTKEIRLEYNKNYFTLDFSGLNYVDPAQTYFKYILENFDRDWTEILVNGQGSVTYTGLPPGLYYFKVYTANNDKRWGDEYAEIKIVITPPLWATVYAFILYLLLTGLIAYFTIIYFIKKKRLKEVKKRILETEKQKQELDQLKFRFFTNISHEFRTPLSLIITPLEALIKREKDKILTQKLSKIYKNAHDLLNLVNQLLDFRKLEMKGEELHLSYGDLVTFIDLFYQTFKEIADNEQKDISLRIKEEHLYLFFDKDKLHKILNNLLSNAFKYTSTGAQIILSLEKVTIENKIYASIKVSDSGAGIPKESLSKIFDRFYQLENKDNSKTGSGIGLHLVKEYVNLHAGKITVESTIDKGSVFTVLIPVDLKKNENEPRNLIPAYTPKITDRKKLLIVEDNDEFRHFLVEQLNEEFQIIEATNGEEGEEEALKEFPDLIITDVMMPKVDGIELCARIKNNIRISHIPVIMLTARASDESKLLGYEAGADEYISKPFNLDILLLRIQKLIEQQEDRKKTFRRTIEVKPSSITITSLDEKLIQKALQSIEENMSNTEYSIDDLSNDIGLSRANLYRKIQSITGETAADFIRSIRLKRAAQLLRDTDLSVSEIADRVGFNTIKYFNRHFKEEFELTPTLYRGK